MALSGSLADFPLEGVLRLLESTRKTGVLEIGAEGEVGELEVVEGVLTGARFGDDVGDAALGVIFAMADGSFSYRPGMPRARNLSGSLEAILERAAEERERMLAIRRAIPSDRMRFALSERALSGGPITIAPEHWRVLLNVDGSRDVNALASVAGQGRLATLRQLHELVAAGLVDALEPAREPPPPPPPPPVEQPPAPSSWRTAGSEPPRWEATPVEPPLPAPEPPPQDFWQAQMPPAPPPADVAPQPATEDLSALLHARLSGLEQSAPAEPAPAPRLPPDFWETRAATPAPPAPLPVIELPSAPAAEAETDDRLAALSGRATTMEPTLTPPAPVEPAPAPHVAGPSVSHWLPADTTAPILEVETPAPVKEEKHRGFFGLGRKRVEATPAPGAAAPAASSPGRLASFANALIAEYNSGQYGKARLDERMNVRLRIVDEQADPLDRMLPVQDDRLDVAAIDREFTSQEAGPYLATLVRQIFEDAERLLGRDKAKKGYRAAIRNALGDDESVLRDGVIAPILPRV